MLTSRFTISAAFKILGVTPAMEAGLTDHIRDLPELLEVLQTKVLAA